MLTLLRYILKWFRQPVVLTQKRAGQWATVRKHFLEKHISCAACGKIKELEVHHVIPFCVDPSLELAEDNLIALCRVTCHLLIGHLGNWQTHNSHVREDAALILSRVREVQEQTQASK